MKPGKWLYCLLVFPAVLLMIAVEAYVEAVGHVFDEIETRRRFYRELKAAKRERGEGSKS